MRLFSNASQTRGLILAVLLGLKCPAAVPAAEPSVRFATFNIQELSLKKLDEVDAAGRGTHPQLLAAAAVLRRIRPDVLLLNEIDYTGPADADGPIERNAARLFMERYLQHAEGESAGLDYPHLFYRSTNTGVPTGIDLNNDGDATGPNDAYGYGTYPGEYGMALLSRFPIDESKARTFRKLLWKDVPNGLIPDGQDGRPAFYTPAAKNVFRLSSKSHWDVPVECAGRTIHCLCSHPTPPVFDGPEDAHGRRNHDELRFWCDYLTGGPSAAWIRDDQGSNQPLDLDARFVILGDLNADPDRGDAVAGKRPIRCLLEHPRVFDPQPTSQGAVAATRASSLFPETRQFKTANFGRIDYVLPSRTLSVGDRGVFSPVPSDHEAAIVKRASDHRLVWVDIRLTP